MIWIMTCLMSVLTGHLWAPGIQGPGYTSHWYVPSITQHRSRQPKSRSGDGSSMNVHRLLIHHSQEWFLKRKKKKEWFLCLECLQCRLLLAVISPPPGSLPELQVGQPSLGDPMPTLPPLGHHEVMRRKPDRQGGSGFQGFRKAAPNAHLKDDICLSDACFNRLLPNFCDTGRRPSPISFQIRINLEL